MRSRRVGDQRINPFGVGGEIEIRSGLAVKNSRSRVHNFIRIGRADRTEVVRVIWPNGHGARRVWGEG